MVVTRWYGGIKLGAGGLVRAYGGTAAECLRLAPRELLVAMAGLELACAFEDLGTVHAALHAQGKLDVCRLVRGPTPRQTHETQRRRIGGGKEHAAVTGRDPLLRRRSRIRASVTTTGLHQRVARNRHVHAIDPSHRLLRPG